MTTEDAYRDWAELDSDERLKALEDAANEALSSAGYDPVKVAEGDFENGMSTDPENGNIYASSSSLAGDDAYEAFSSVYHEAWHSMDIQDGVYDRLASDEREAFNDIEESSGYYDEDGELREDRVYAIPEHDNAEAYGDAMADAVRDSAEVDFDFEIDFANVTVTDEPSANPPRGSTGAESGSDDFGFEIDWDHVVVSSADNDSDKGAAEHYEGGHAVPSP